MIGKIFLASPEYISLFILWLLPWEKWNKVAYINFDYHYSINRIEVLYQIYSFVLPQMQELTFLSYANSKLHNWLKDLRKIHFGISKANHDSAVTWQTCIPDKKLFSVFFFYVLSLIFFHLNFWKDFTFLRKKWGGKNLRRIWMKTTVQGFRFSCQQAMFGKNIDQD